MLKNLKNLHLQYSGIKNLLKSFGELNNLEELKLCGYLELMMLSDSLGNLKNLKNLVSINYGIKNLSEFFGELKHHICYFERFPISQFNERSSRLDLICIFSKSWNSLIIMNMVY